jgi:hypothetical protein
MSQRESPRATRSVAGLWIVGTVVLVIGVALVIALAHRPPKKKAEADGPASPTVVHEMRSIPNSVFETVGTGTAVNGPQPISESPLRIGSKPEVLYIGAEYCPYCATERWPLVVALSRFGTFKKLKITHSSSTDSYPRTTTFSFHHVTYQSPYLAFTGVELSTNHATATGYTPLDKLTAAQTDIFRTYTQRPYSTTVGSIPFIDFGGKYLVTAVSYDPGVLKDKTALEIADALHDPTTAVSKGAVGVSNLFTATICRLTENRPTSVCRTNVITRLEQSMPR